MGYKVEGGRILALKPEWSEEPGDLRTADVYFSVCALPEYREAVESMTARDLSEHVGRILETIPEGTADRLALFGLFMAQKAEYDRRAGVA